MSDTHTRVLNLYHNCDTNTLYDCDEKSTFIFCSRRMEAGSHAIRRSRIVVVSQSNRNCNHGINGHFPSKLGLAGSVVCCVVPFSSKAVCVCVVLNLLSLLRNNLGQQQVV